jgi:hypothetical protein
MPRTRDRKVNEKSFKSPVNSRKTIRFYPLSFQKTVFKVANEFFLLGIIELFR